MWKHSVFVGDTDAECQIDTLCSKNPRSTLRLNCATQEVPGTSSPFCPDKMYINVPSPSLTGFFQGSHLVAQEDFKNRIPAGLVPSMDYLGWRLTCFLTYFEHLCFAHNLHLAQDLVQPCSAMFSPFVQPNHATRICLTAESFTSCKVFGFCRALEDTS